MQTLVASKKKGLSVVIELDLFLPFLQAILAHDKVQPEKWPMKTLLFIYLIFVYTFFMFIWDYFDSLETNHN